MQAAIRSATKWLITVTRKDALRLNPMPYNFFKKALEKQIGWAREQRNINLDFDMLADCVRDKLLQEGIRVIGNNTKPAAAQKHFDDEAADLDFNAVFNPKAEKHTPHLTIDFNGDTKQAMTALFNWFYSIMNKAQVDNCSQVSLTAEFKNS